MTACASPEKEEVSLKPYCVDMLAKEKFEVAETTVAETEEQEVVEETEEEPEETVESSVVGSVDEPEQISQIMAVDYVETEIDYVEPDYEEEMPTPADEFEYYDQTFIGTYAVTWYTREAVGYDAPGASGNGLQPYYSCAMPDYNLMNCTVLVEGYGIYHVDDVSPAGIVDLYVMYNSEIPSYGMGSANVYVIEG